MSIRARRDVMMAARTWSKPSPPCAGLAAMASGSLKLGRGAQEAPLASSSTPLASSFMASNRSAKLGSTEAGSLTHRA